MTLTEIVAAIGKLDQRELTVVQAAVNSRLQPDIGEEKYSLLADCLIKGGICDANIFNQFKLSKYYSDWKKNAKVLTEFAYECWPEFDTKKVNERRIYSLLLRLITDDLKARNIPVSVGSVVLNMGRIAQLFDAGFPDYRQSGLAHVALKQKPRGE